MNFLQAFGRHATEDECVADEQRRLHHTKSTSRQTRTTVRRERVCMNTVRLNRDPRRAGINVVPRTDPRGVSCETRACTARIVKVIVNGRLAVRVPGIVHTVRMVSFRDRRTRMGVCGQV